MTRVLVKTRSRGYTITEVLMAMAIFTIGFAMVATIFPSALLLQKRTVDNVLSRQATANAEAIITNRGLDTTTLNTDMNAAWPLPANTWDRDQQVWPLPPDMLPYSFTSPSPVTHYFTLADRGYPITIRDQTDRDYYWVPLLRDADPTAGTSASASEWNVYFFVLRRSRTLDYPNTTGIWANVNDAMNTTDVPRVSRIGVSIDTVATPPRILVQNQNFDNTNNGVNNDTPAPPSDELLIPVGTKIVDNNGTIYVVTDADQVSIRTNGSLTPNPNPINFVWFGHPGRPDSANPTMDVILLTDVVN
jgi:prepilin-type N-terminal cleavage/methylation domain-containing protein